MDLLWRVKSAVVRGHVAFTEKARIELERDDLLETDVLESLLNATFIRTKRSSSRFRKHSGEKVCIITSFSFKGVFIYTKGVLRREQGSEEFYILVSSKRAVST